MNRAKAFEAAPVVGTGMPMFAVSENHLESGYRFAVESAATGKMAGIAMTVGVGGIDDPEGKEGLAHFVEHLAFRAFVQRNDKMTGQKTGRKYVATPSTLDAYLDSLGATGVNAYTGPDRTVYVAFVPEENLGPTLGAFRHVVERPLDGVDTDAAAVEKAVLGNELRQVDKDGVGAQVRDWLAEALFEQEFVGAAKVGGTEASIAGFDLNDARRFVATHYVPKKSPFVVSTGLPPQQVIQLFENAEPPTRTTSEQPDGSYAETAQDGGIKQSYPNISNIPGTQNLGNIQDAGVPLVGTVLPGAGRAVSTKAADAKGAVSTDKDQSVPPDFDVDIKLPPQPKDGGLVRYAAVDEPLLLVAWRLPSTYGEAGHISQIITSGPSRHVMSNVIARIEEVENVDILVHRHRTATVLSSVMTLSAPDVWRSVARRVAEIPVALWMPQPEPPDSTDVQGAYDSPKELAAREHRKVLTEINRWSIGRTILDVEDWSYRLLARADFYHYVGDSSRLEEQLRLSRRTTSKDIASVVPTYLAADKARAIFIQRGLVSTNHSVVASGYNRLGGLDVVADKPGRVATVGLPPVVGADDRGETRTRTFPNGLRVILAKRPWYPSVAATLSFKHEIRTLEDSAHLELIRYVETERNEAAVAQGLFAEANDFDGTTMDTIWTGRSNLPAALFALQERMVIPDTSVWWLRKRDDMQAERDKAKAAENDLSLSKKDALDFYRSYAAATSGKRRELPKPDSISVRAFIDRNRRPENATLTIAGDIDFQGRHVVGGVGVRQLVRTSGPIFGNIPGASNRARPTR